MNRTRSELAVKGLGLIVLDQHMVIETLPAPDTKILAESHRLQVGGPVPTALAQLRRFGVKATVLGSWGEDSAGKAIEADLDREEIGYERTPSSTGIAHVWVERKTGRRTVVASPPDTPPTPAIAETFGRGASLLHLDGWGGEAAFAAAHACHAAGGVVSLDTGSVKPATESILPFVSVLNAPIRFVRENCRTSDPAEGAKQLLEAGPRLVTITDGDRGAGVYTPDIATWLPAFPVDAVDTCGAGDVFCGGLLFGLLRELDPVAMLRFAMATAALKVTRIGNREALPREEDVRAFLDRN